MDEIKARRVALIPVLLLLVVASIQIYLAHNLYLTPWKGGGFGMFSTTDGNANRSLRIYVTGPNRSEGLLLKGSLEDLAARAQAFPGDHQLETLAKAIYRDQQRKQLPIDKVHIEVLRTVYEKPDLQASLQVIRKYSYP